MVYIVFFFFFKQKTAYEMRISYWSSDVCSSDLRARVKALSKDVGRLRGQGDAAGAEDLMAQSRALGDQEKALDVEVSALTDEVRDLLLRTPNVPADDCPDGAGEADHVVLRTEGYDAAAYDAHSRVTTRDRSAARGGGKE